MSGLDEARNKLALANRVLAHEGVLDGFGHGPVKIISFVIFLFFGLDLYDWPPELEGFLDKCFRLLVAFTVTYTLLKAVDMASRKSMSAW